jgi:O-antigen ligase
MAARLDARGRLWQLTLAGVAVLLGVGAGVDPRIAVAGAIGLAFVALVMADITVGLCLFVVISFLDVLPSLGGSLLSFSKIVGFLLAASWLAKVSTSTDARNDFLAEHPAFTYVLALFVGWAALSMTWAEDASAGTTPVMRYALNLILFLIVYTAVKTPRQALWAIGAYVTGAAVAAGYGVLHPPPDVAYYEVSRATGTIGDPNELAAVLVGGTVLAAGLAVVSKHSPLLRIGATAASVLCLLGIFLTLSRGGLVALIVALVASVLFGGRWRYRALMLAAVIAFGSFMYFGYFAGHDAVSRVTKVEGGTGRQDIWKIGWRMVRAHPVSGVGVGNFQTSSIHYLLAPGSIQRDEFIVDTPKVAHNTYLHVLSELGVVGLTMFVAILGFALVSILRAARCFARLGDEAMELVCRSLLVSLFGVLAADFFISAMFNKQLWFLLGLGPALLAIGRARERDGAEESLAERDGWDPAGAIAPPQTAAIRG